MRGEHMQGKGGSKGQVTLIKPGIIVIANMAKTVQLILTSGKHQIRQTNSNFVN